MSIEKISDFVSCQLFMFTSVIKLTNFDSKSQMNTFFLSIKTMVLDLNMSFQTLSDLI